MARGGQWEQVALEWLQGKGWRLVERNYHCRLGEIDLIMRDADVLVFVEVRYRKSAGFGSAVESVDRRKQQKLLLAARHYLRQWSGAEPVCRFDVVAISGAGGSAIEWSEDAFGE